MTPKQWEKKDESKSQPKEKKINTIHYNPQNHPKPKSRNPKKLKKQKKNKFKPNIFLLLINSLQKIATKHSSFINKQCYASLAIFPSPLPCNLSLHHSTFPVKFWKDGNLQGANQRSFQSHSHRSH